MESNGRDDARDSAAEAARLARSRRIARAGKPWLRATAAGLLTPILLECADRWLGMLPQDGPGLGVPGFGWHEPLHPRTRLVTGVAWLVFWHLAPIVPPEAGNSSVSLRLLASRLFRRVGFAVLLGVIPLLAATWTLAVSSGWAAPEIWAETTGNHGPWRHVYDLRKLVWIVLGLPPLCTVLAAMSWVLKPSRAALALAVAGILALALVVASHVWLID